MWEIMNSVFNKSSEGLMASEKFISGKKFVMVSLTGGAMTLVMGQYYKTFFEDLQIVAMLIFLNIGTRPIFQK